METTAQDLRHGIRSLRRTPAFTLTALATLALTMAAVSTVFSLANALLFRGPNASHPDEIVTVAATRRHWRAFGHVSHPDYVRFRDNNQTLKGLAAYYPTAPFWVTMKGASKEADGAVVSSNFFPLLGTVPKLGRFFRPDEDSVPDRDRVAVLGSAFWREWFGGSEDALDATLTINGVAFTVIGVAPDGFRGVLGASPRDIYIPTMMLHVGYRWCDALAGNCDILSMVGRLRPDTTVEQARADMARLVPPEWAHAEEDHNSGLAVFQPRGTEDPEALAENKQSMALLTSVAGVLLLACCANLAGLLIARSSSRLRELAIRASVGASRGRLVRQLTTESLLLAVLGGGAGVLLSLGLTRWLEASFYAIDAEGYRRHLDFNPDVRVIAAVGLVSLAASALFGLLPGLNAIAGGAELSLARQASASRARPRWARALVAAQAAVAVGLVAVASLLVAGAHRLLTRPGFDPSHVALLRVRPRLLAYTPERARRFQRDVLTRLEGLPGVTSVSMVGTGCVFCGSSEDVSSPDTPGSHQATTAHTMDVGPAYFHTMRIPLLSGRELGPGDTMDSAPVAVVNQALASRLWSVGAAVGSTLVVRGRPHRVVGVVADIGFGEDEARPDRFAYVPYWQNPAAVDARYCIRVAGDPAAMLPALAREVSQIDPGVPVTEGVTLQHQVAAVFERTRIGASVFSYAALLSILLSGVGLYGTLAFSVSRRTKEVGIRMALGAGRRTVLAMIVREGTAIVGVGVVLGIGIAVVGTQVARHRLYVPPATDAWHWMSAATLVLFVGLVACFFPARRAARTEPTDALRDD